MAVWIRCFCLLLLLGITAQASAGVKDDYEQGVALFKALEGNAKRAALRSEWTSLAERFGKIAAADPKGEFAPRSVFQMGRAYEEMARRSWLKADRQKAVDAYDKLVATAPKNALADDALLRKGLILQDLAKEPDKARETFQAVLTRYPDGDMAAEAKRQLGKPTGKGVEAVAGDIPTGTAKSETPSPASKAAKSGAKDAKADVATALTSIRHWSSNEYTRVVMDLSQNTHFERNLVPAATGSGKQLQIALANATVGKNVKSERAIKDGILSRITVGPNTSGGVVVALDLERLDHYRVFTLPDPYRLVLDVFGGEPGKPGVREENRSADKPADVPGEKAVETSKTESGKGGAVSGKAEKDGNHVQAALAEIQAKAAAKTEPDKNVTRDEPTKIADGAAHGKGARNAEHDTAGGKDASRSKKQEPEDEPEKKPGLTVNAKQRKLAGTLVEQLGLTVRSIMIDAGHGGKDPGAMANGAKEKDVNLRVAKAMGEQLRARGFEVHYTRTQDKFISLEERTALANAKNVDLFISVHCNSYKDEGVSGMEVYYLNLATDAQAVRVAARENGVSAKKISDMQFILSDLMLNSKINESRQLAGLVDKEARHAQSELASHGSRGAFFYVLTGARMPAVLVEVGYLTNPAEARRLGTAEYVESLARGLVDGVVAYKKKLEKVAG